MRKLILSVLVVLLFFACGTMKHTENEYKGEGDDVLSTLLGLNSDGLSTDIKKYLSTPLYRFSADCNQGEYKYWQDGDWQSVPIATIDKQLYQHDGRIYDKDSGRIDSYCNFSMYFGDSIYYLASFNESGMLKTFRYVWRNYSSAEIYTECDSLGNITEVTDGMGRIVRTEKFKNGKGWWYDYYIFPPPEGESVLDWDSSLESHFTIKIKSKGRLKNNFKVGCWKYYDPQGRLVRTERFRLRDSVDIRFPYSVIPKK